MAKIGNYITLRGKFRAFTHSNGEIIQEIRKDNLIVNVGKQLLAELVGALNGAVAVNCIAVGTDSSTPQSGDTILGTEIYREPTTEQLITTFTANDTCKFTMTIDEGDSSANGALTEAGLFGGNTANPLNPNDPAGVDSGVLLSHVTFSAINKTPSVSLTIQWDIIFQ